MQKIIQYLKDVQSEMMKVSWPNRNELTGATLLVIILSIAVALFVYACDKLIFKILSLFLKSSW
jgi:preprotein translocase subunit SecE